MEFPLQLSFKAIALAAQLSVTDATGKLVCYVKKKAFKLKEDVTVFADKEQTSPLYTIKADRIIDWNAKYALSTAAGAPIGMVQRQGSRSLFKAHYDLSDANGVIMTIHEENPWAKFFDALFGEIPILGIFSGYVFNPKYLVTRTDGTDVMRITKKPAMLEGKFMVDKLTDISETEEIVGFLGIMMMVMLERARG